VFCLGIDNDTSKVDITKHNGGVYGLDGTDFNVIESDFLKLDPTRVL
jgi:hypothetical protein